MPPTRYPSLPVGQHYEVIMSGTLDVARAENPNKQTSVPTSERHFHYCKHYLSDEGCVLFLFPNQSWELKTVEDIVEKGTGL